MSAITPNQARGVGFRMGQIMLLDPTTGYPVAPSTAAYLGVQLSAGKVLELNSPDVRRITHTGGDGVVGLDFLPPQEGLSGTLQVSGTDFDLDALLTGNLVHTVGESKRLLAETSLRGYEKDVLALFYQAALTGGRRSWRYFIMPAATIVPFQAGMDDNPEARRYAVIPHYTTADEFQVPYTALTQGATRAQLITGVARGKPTLTSWKGDGTTTAFTFDTAQPALSTATIRVAVDGADVSAGITTLTTGVTWSAAPASGKILNVFYEAA